MVVLQDLLPPLARSQLSEFRSFHIRQLKQNPSKFPEIVRKDSYVGTSTFKVLFSFKVSRRHSKILCERDDFF